MEMVKRGEIPRGWKEVQLKDIAVIIETKNTINNSNVLTISAQYGLISQKDFFKKEIASKNKENYYLLQRNDFAYNKSYSGGYIYGACLLYTSDAADE